jgi:predicted transcriptional regulator
MGGETVLSGKELKIKRIIKGLKVMEVAEMLGVHRTYISKLENEDRAIPLHIYKKWVTLI